MKASAGVVALVLLSLALVGYSSRTEVSGEYRSLQYVTATGTVYFPKKSANKHVTASADTAQAVAVVSIARVTGTGVGKFCIYSRGFSAGHDTCYVGTASYTSPPGTGDAGIDSVICADVAGSTFHVEGFR